MSHATSAGRETGFQGSFRIDCKYANIGTTQDCRHLCRNWQVTTVRTVAVWIRLSTLAQQHFLHRPQIVFPCPGCRLGVLYANPSGDFAQPSTSVGTNSFNSWNDHPNLASMKCRNLLREPSVRVSFRPRKGV